MRLKKEDMNGRDCKEEDRFHLIKEGMTGLIMSGLE